MWMLLNHNCPFSSTDEFSSHFASGGEVVSVYNVTELDGQSLTHAVVLNGINSNGDYTGYDPTTNESVILKQNEINPALMLGVDRL